MNPIKALLKNDYALIAMLVGVAIASFKTPVTLLIGFSAMLAAFDAQGYFKVLQRRENGDETTDKEIIGAYRVMQLAFQCMLLWNSYNILHDWPIVAAILLWHFAGINDVLYYFFLKQRIPAALTWLWWTPGGFVYEILLKRPTPRFVMQIQAGLGCAMSVFIIF